MPIGVYKRKKMPLKEKRAKAAARQRNLYKNSPEQRDYQKSLKLKKAYGITLEQYNEFSDFCSNVCGICDKPCPSGRKLAVDHEHSTGIIRGLLCINCNKGIGNFKDSVELMEAAIHYLKSYKEAVEESRAVNQRQEQEIVR